MRHPGGVRFRFLVLVIVIVFLVCGRGLCAEEPGPGTLPSIAIYACHQAFLAADAVDAPAASDPLDPAQVRVDARIRAPDGSERVQPCFWYVAQEAYQQLSFSTDQKRDVPWERFRDAAAGRWCLRFSPDRPGIWSWSFTMSVADRVSTTAGGEVLAEEPADVRGRGPVVRSANGRGFATADGAPFIPIGINCGWPTEAGSAVYERWLTSLATVGANASRLWLVHYYGGTSLEWTASGVNDGYRGIGAYSHESAERLDRIFAAAERRGIKVMLCLYTFGDFAWDWPSNPMSIAGGGWLERPMDFFTDAKARTATHNLMRYLVARYGASPSLWAWELWNEVDTIEGFDDQACTAWHREMARVLKDLDAHRHLVTTDYRFTPPISACGAYALPEIDFIQLHTYWPTIPDAFQLEHKRLATYGKPIVIGEYGLHVYPESLEADPIGMHVHDGLWAGVFAGSCGGGMAWWWDKYVDARDLWGHCTGIARFLADERIDDLHPATATCDGPGLALALVGPGRVWAWIQNRRLIAFDPMKVPVQVSQYSAPEAPQATSVTVHGEFTGAWQVDVVDTFDGITVARRLVTTVGGTLTIPLPAFRHDVALKARRAEPGALPPLPPDKAATPWHDRISASGGTK